MKYLKSAIRQARLHNAPFNTERAKMFAVIVIKHWNWEKTFAPCGMMFYKGKHVDAYDFRTMRKIDILCK